jgi:hypothetical protein
VLIGDVLDDVVIKHPGSQLVGRHVLGARQDRLAGALHIAEVTGVDLQHAELTFHIEDSRLDARYLPQRQVDDAFDRQRR